jgi:hypothetical protein
MIEISIRLQRRHAPSPPKPRTRPKPAGQIPREPIALIVPNTHALFNEESQSFLQVLLLFRSAVAPEASSLSVKRAVRSHHIKPGMRRFSAGPTLKLLLRNPLSSIRSFGMQSFESCRPSQPVRSPPANVRRPLKTAQYRVILRISLGLRVGNWAREEAFQRLVSEAVFWCLVLLELLIDAGSGLEAVTGTAFRP